MTVDAAVTVLGAVCIVTVALLFSYGLARAGEPQSVWLWCSILRAC